MCPPAICNVLQCTMLSWSGSWGVRHPSGTRDQFFFYLEIIFRQLRVCYFVAPFLMRGRVCNLLLLLVLASAVLLGSESCGTQDHILLSEFLRLPQPGGSGTPYLYPTGTGWPRYTPGSWVPFEVEVEVNLRPTVSRPVRLGIGPPFVTLDQILSCSSFFCW
jgi:hypothetical protein